MQFITTQGFINMIKARKGAIILTIHTATNPRMKKSWTGGEVWKVCKTNGVVRFNYEKSVNRQRVREDKPNDFQSQGRVWGERLDAFVIKGNKVYVTIKIEKRIDERYTDNEGNMLSLDEIAPHMYGAAKAHKQGLDKDVMPRDYWIENIKAVTINNETYHIMHSGNYDV
jgi:hypothetical protein